VLPLQLNSPDLNKRNKYTNIMSVISTWDMPLATWSSGAFWDEAQPVNNPKRNIMNTKAIISFRQYRDGDFNSAAFTIHEQMTLNASVFTTPTVTMAVLLTQCNDYNAKLAAKATRSKADTLACTVARQTLAESLRLLGNYVNNTAKGDPTIVMQSGFPSYTTVRPVNDNPPPPPTDLRMSQGPTSGTCILRYKTGRTPSMNEVQVNTGDPKNELDWASRGNFTGGRVNLTGFTAGTIVWTRVRTHGIKGTLGDWSDPAQMRLL